MGLDLDQREIGSRIGTDHSGIERAVVVERHIEAVGAFDHMVVGDNIAVGTQHHTRTEPKLLLALLGLRLLTLAALAESGAEKVFKKRINILLITALTGISACGGVAFDAHYAVDGLFGSRSQVDRLVYGGYGNIRISSLSDKQS